jgi:hypothetical protein
MRVLVTGSRHWTDTGAIQEQLTELDRRHRKPITLVHGGQVSLHPENRSRYGADYLAAMVAGRLGWLTEEFPAEWERFGRAAGPIRNQMMVDHGADVCLVFPMWDSRGTWDCARRAKEAGIPLIVVRKYIEPSVLVKLKQD